MKIWQVLRDAKPGDVYYCAAKGMSLHYRNSTNPDFVWSDGKRLKAIAAVLDLDFVLGPLQPVSLQEVRAALAHGQRVWVQELKDSPNLWAIDYKDGVLVTVIDGKPVQITETTTFLIRGNPESQEPTGGETE